MPPLSRRALLATLGTATVAGCTVGPRPGSPSTAPATDGSPTGTTSPTGGTPTADWLYRASNRPDPDHAVYLANEGARELTVRVRVRRRATGETVHDETATVAPGQEREVYNLRRADPDGVEAFEVCGRLADPTPTEPATTASGATDAAATAEPTGTAQTPGSPRADCVTMRTNECFGTAHVTVDDGGELRVVYSIC